MNSALSSVYATPVIISEFPVLIFSRLLAQGDLRTWIFILSFSEISLSISISRPLNPPGELLSAILNGAQVSKSAI